MYIPLKLAAYTLAKDNSSLFADIKLQIGRNQKESIWRDDPKHLSIYKLGILTKNDK